MNLLGHTFVADAIASTGPGPADDEFVLGAVLPDIVSIAHVRLDRARLDGRIGDGVECHTRTDAVFHGHPAFVQGAGAIRRELVERGMASGPGRAIGHIGWELLLDGTLLGTTTEDSFRSAMALVDQASDAVVADQSERWARFVANRHRMGALHYDDPAWVTDRLYNMLAVRPRLSFDPADIPLVTEVLTAHLPTITAAAEPVLADVSTAVSGGGGG